MHSAKNILFLGILYPKRSPSQRFRYEQFIPILEKEGFVCKLKWIINKEDEKAFYDGTVLGKILVFVKSTIRMFKIVLSNEKYDRIFIQREAYFLGTTFFEFALSKKATIIYDFDDSIWLPNISENNKMYSFLKRPRKTNQLLKLANKVIAGNQFLANYALQFNTNVTIIPTCVDTQKYRPAGKKMDNRRIVIGWVGSHTTIMHLEGLVPTLIKIKLRFGDKVDFLVVGDSNFYNQDIDIRGTAWRESDEIQDLSKIDIGIMPLPDNDWSQGKCGFKGIQYMSMEIPTIMSSVGVNNEIIQNGTNGFLVSNEEEWLEKLTLLIENPELREKIGKQGRKTVEDKYSVKANIESFIKVIVD